MASLEELLKKNYHQLRDGECADAVLRFLRVTPSVYGMRPIFVKMLVKVSHHILKKEPEKMVGLLERLLKITTEGIDIVRRLPVEKRFEGDESLHSHLWSYQADFAEELYRRTGDLSYALLQYESRVQAASLTENRNSEYMARMNLFATKAARTLFGATNEQEWADKARGHAELALHFYEWIKNPDEVASRQFDIAMIAKDVLRMFPTEQNARRLYADALKAAERCSEAAKKEAFVERFFYEAAKAAGWLAEHAKHTASEKTETDGWHDKKFQRVEWLEREHDCLRTAACISIRNAPGRAVGNYLKARNTAKTLYAETGNKVWLELTFDSQASAAMIAEEHREKGSALLHRIAGDDALTLYQTIRCREENGLVKDYFWAEAAYRHRQKAAELYARRREWKETESSSLAAGRIVRECYQETRELEWAERWLEAEDATFQQARRTKRKDIARASCLSAGEAAEEIDRIRGEQGGTYAVQRAISYYQEYIRSAATEKRKDNEIKERLARLESVLYARKSLEDDTPVPIVRRKR